MGRFIIWCVLDDGCVSFCDIFAPQPHPHPIPHPIPPGCYNIFKEWVISEYKLWLISKLLYQRPRSGADSTVTTVITLIVVASLTIWYVRIDSCQLLGWFNTTEMQNKTITFVTLITYWREWIGIDLRPMWRQKYKRSIPDIKHRSAIPSDIVHIDPTHCSRRKRLFKFCTIFFTESRNQCKTIFSHNNIFSFSPMNLK